MPLGRAVAIRGFSWPETKSEIVYGLKNIHTNPRTQGFPLGHCTVTINIDIHMMCQCFNVVVDQCTFIWYIPTYVEYRISPINGCLAVLNAWGQRPFWVSSTGSNNQQGNYLHYIEINAKSSWFCKLNAQAINWRIWYFRPSCLLWISNYTWMSSQTEEV